MNMTTTHTLTPAQATEARRLLRSARDNITQALADDLAALLRASPCGSSTSDELPEGTPPWLIIATLEAALPDGSVCWDIARAHLTNATASRLAYATAQDASEELKEATGGAACYALVLALGLNLYEFAGECWAKVGRMAMQEASNV